MEMIYEFFSDQKRKAFDKRMKSLRASPVSKAINSFFSFLLARSFFVNTGSEVNLRPAPSRLPPCVCFGVVDSESNRIGNPIAEAVLLVAGKPLDDISINIVGLLFISSSNLSFISFLLGYLDFSIPNSRYFTTVLKY